MQLKNTLRDCAVNVIFVHSDTTDGAPPNSICETRRRRRRGHHNDILKM